MNIGSWINEVHQCAKEHGWWDDERDPREAIALMHSELSEALEEARADRPMVWHKCVGGLETINCEGHMRPETAICTKEACDCTVFDCMVNKPEGIAVELVDCAIRIMDFMGYYGIEYEPKSKRLFYATPEEPLPIFVCKLHAVLSRVFEEPFNPKDGSAIDLETGVIYDSRRVGLCFSDALDMIFSWIRAHGGAPESVLKEKADYNKSRPYRHGKKF